MQYRRIPFYRPSLTEKEEAAVLRVVKSKWLTTGEEALHFEKEFSAFTKTKFALAVSSATAGLHLALLASDMPQGTGIIVPSYTFAASAHCIVNAGYRPVFVDIEEQGFNIDPQKADAILADPPFPISGIMAVHVSGRGCNMEAISRLADQYELFVVEDAAHSFPASTEGKFFGSLGNIGVFSFYATKTLTTGEGGMIVTNDAALAKKMRSARLHGMDQDAWFRYKHTSHSRYDIIGPGFKYNLPDILASIGRVQLARSQEMFNLRKKIVGYYREALEDCEFLRLPPHSEAHSWHLFIVRLKLQSLSIDRDAFVQRMQHLGVSSSLHFFPLHLTQYFSQYTTPLPLHNTETRYKEVISLPLFCDLSKEDIHYISEVIKKSALS